MRNILNTVLAVAAVAAAAAPASADPIFVDGIAADRVHTTIDVRGLDAAEADRRIARAARQVCGDAESRSIAAFARINTCRSAATADARRQLAATSGATGVVVAAIY